jgi:hypothetical protein
VRVAASILSRLSRLGVGAAVQFYNQPLLWTVEIDDVMTHGVLPAKPNRLLKNLVSAL